jgi:hypothetical protein
MGWNEDLFSPGDEISFRAHANRDPEKNRLYLNSVTASGGETYALLEQGDDSSEPEPIAIATSLEGTWRVDTERFDELFEIFENHPLTAVDLHPKLIH